MQQLLGKIVVALMKFKFCKRLHELFCDSCRDLFKLLRILTLACVFILKYVIMVKFDTDIVNNVRDNNERSNL